MADTAQSLLVVDDSSDFRSLYTLWLGDQYDLRTATDGVEALDMVDGTVDAVVLDREMPRKDGVTVARELAASEFDPAVVMVSGVEPGAQLLEIPVDDYLQKPVTKSEVVDALERVSEAADRSASVRDRRALDRRLEVVGTATNPGKLVDSEPYQRAVAAIDGEPDASRPRASPNGTNMGTDRPSSSPQRR